MKKLLLSCIAVLPAFLFGQTTILSDNFDSYTAGGFLALQGPTLWDTWSGAGGTAEDGLISSAQAVSMANSLQVKNGGADVYEDDIILLFPSTYTTGAYEFKCKIYVPQGKGGYFNLGGNWVTGGAGYQYGGDFYFNADGSGFVDAPGTLTFTHNISAWNTVRVLVNLTSGTKELFINGTSIGTEPWGAAAGFGVVDIFAVGYADGTGAPQVGSEFFVDDVELIQLSVVGLEENILDAEVSIYPSPNNGQFKLDFKNAQSDNYSVKIIDVSGLEVENSTINVNESASMQFNLNVAAGFYFLTITNGTTSLTQKIVIK